MKEKQLPELIYMEKIQNNLWSPQKFTFEANTYFIPILSFQNYGK